MKYEYLIQEEDYEKFKKQVEALALPKEEEDEIWLARWDYLYKKYRLSDEDIEHYKQINWVRK